MKREERHRIHRNDLADWLGKWIERAKPHSNLIVLVVLLAALLAGGSVWWLRRSAAESAHAWEGVHRAWIEGRPSGLETIVEQYPETDAAHFASVLAGNMYLSNGCDELFNNKSNAISELNKAVEHYRIVQEESENPKLLAQAYYGLGRAYEALAGTRQSQGEVLDDAISAYQQVVDRWPNGVYGKLAARRLEELNRRDIRAFYDQFAQWDPKPAFSDLPGMPDGPLPFDWKSLSDEGPLPDLGRSRLLDDLQTDQAAPEDESSSATDSATESSTEPTESEKAGTAESEDAGVQDESEKAGAAESEDAGVQDETKADQPSAPDEAAAPQTPAQGPSEPEQPAPRDPAAPDEPSTPEPATSEGPSGASPAADKESTKADT